MTTITTVALLALSALLGLGAARAMRDPIAPLPARVLVAVIFGIGALLVNPTTWQLVAFAAAYTVRIYTTRGMGSPT